MSKTEPTTFKNRNQRYYYNYRKEYQAKQILYYWKMVAAGYEKKRIMPGTQRWIKVTEPAHE